MAGPVSSLLSHYTLCPSPRLSRRTLPPPSLPTADPPPLIPLRVVRPSLFPFLSLSHYTLCPPSPSLPISVAEPPHSTVAVAALHTLQVAGNHIQKGARLVYNIAIINHYFLVPLILAQGLWMEELHIQSSLLNAFNQYVTLFCY
ncbi:uncharacterized protein LOC133298629 [Gastrolobium bilobum]|uniref:uncharacterized protein LOC133298629 n=1 Tax=Gastrolobium bilobum TaxID=150636 RepID=UPI002AB1B7BF|nr:uncharacterized protein LOC133298629 [Gastrolobium bilobum]